MADVDNITEFQTNIPVLQLVRAQLTGSTSTFTSKFGTIKGCMVLPEGTNGATYTVSGNTITITGTNNDWVNIFIWGV